jgi:hypothetical protein
MKLQHPDYFLVEIGCLCKVAIYSVVFTIFCRLRHLLIASNIKVLSVMILPYSNECREQGTLHLFILET